MKRFFAILLSAILLLSCLSLNGCGEKRPEWMDWSETPAEDFQYTLSDDKKEVYIQKYLGTDERVVIPSYIDDLPVTSLKGVPLGENGLIAEGVFEDNATVKEVVLPATLQSIGMSAFGGCTALVTVYLPQESALEVVGDSAFWGCTSLKSLDLSSTSVWIIASRAFIECTALQEIRFPETLTEIRDRAFYQCTSLMELQFPSSLKTMGTEAFSHCTSLRRVNIPAQLDLNVLDAICFNEVPALEQITVDEGRENLDGYAFFALTGKTEIIIPASVKKISPHVFFIYGDNVSMKFLGDCPELIGESTEFSGHPTFCYDPATKGWEDCPWKGDHTFKPIEE